MLTGLGLDRRRRVSRPASPRSAATLLLAAIGLPAMRSQCARYAIAQVRAILADAVRESTIHGVFTDLTGHRFHFRRAA